MQRAKRGLQMRGSCGRIFASSHINNTNHYFSEPPEVIKISQDYQLLLPTIFNPQQKIEKKLTTTIENEHCQGVKLSRFSK